MRRAAIPGLLVLAVLRLPSLMEPHWYTDEAGYLNVARELLKGKVLYSQTWNNKPPLMLWTIALDVKLFGSSEIALHVLTLISGVVAILAIVWAATRLYTPRRALVAGVIAAVILGTPLVDAELALPESLMIAPLSWAGAIVLIRIYRGDPSDHPRRIPRWPLVVGVLMAAAVAYQQTAVAETSAFFLAMLVAPKLLRRDAFIFLGTVAAITGVWLSAAIITAGAGNVAFALAGFYVGYTKQTLPTSALGGFAHFALAGGAALLIAVGAILSRHRPRVRLGARTLGRSDPGRDRGGRPAVSALPGAGGRTAHAARCRHRPALEELDRRRRPAVAGRPSPAGCRPGDRDPDGEGRRVGLGAGHAVGDQLPHPERLLRGRSRRGIRPDLADAVARSFRLPGRRRCQRRGVDHRARVQRGHRGRLVV